MALCLGTACFLSFQVHWIVAQCPFKHFANSAPIICIKKAFSISEISIAALSVFQDWLKTQLTPPTRSTELARLFAVLHHVVWKSLAVSSLCIASALIVKVFTATGILFKKRYMWQIVQFVPFPFHASIPLLWLLLLLFKKVHWNNKFGFSFYRYFFIHPFL